MSYSKLGNEFTNLRLDWYKVKNYLYTWIWLTIGKRSVLLCESDWRLEVVEQFCPAEFVGCVEQRRQLVAHCGEVFLQFFVFISKVFNRYLGLFHWQLWWAGVFHPLVFAILLWALFLLAVILIIAVIEVCHFFDVVKVCFEIHWVFHVHLLQLLDLVQCLFV